MLGKGIKIFISYSRADADAVMRVYDRLAEIGFDPWMDLRDLLPGEVWKKSAKGAIRESPFFLAFFSSKSYNKRGFFRSEVREALDMRRELLDSDIYIIPIRLEETPVPEELSDLHWVDLFKERGWEDLVRALESGIERRKLKSISVMLPKMVNIPKGEFLMGSTGEQVENWEKISLGLLEKGIFGPAARIDSRDLLVRYRSWLEAELGQHVVELPDYLIGKYPVTNAEFSLFIDDRGYYSKQLWTEAGWRWVQGEGEGYHRPPEFRSKPAYWHHEEYGHVNREHPVVGITWFEAVAYTNWLRFKSGLSFRLPTEAEWEKAARGEQGSEWPWGTELSVEGLSLPFVGRISAVGSCPDADSIYGVSDMVGGLWQWCSTCWGVDFFKTEFPYPYMADRRENLEGDAYRHLRGGNWSFMIEVIPRCAFRHWDAPSNWYHLIGFRVASDQLQKDMQL